MEATIIKDETGRETDESIRRRASEFTGFKMDLIVPKYAWLDFDGVCATLRFKVKGRGIWTDFETWELDDDIDEDLTELGMA